MMIIFFILSSLDIVICVLQYMYPDRFPVVYPELPQPPTHRQAIINAFVYVHQSLHKANERLSKRGGRTMAITPRHYLDFINHYVSTRELGGGEGGMCDFKFKGRCDDGFMGQNTVEMGL